MRAVFDEYGFYLRKALQWGVFTFVSWVALSSEAHAIAISVNRDLSFGSALSGAGGGTVTVDPSGNLSYTGNAQALAGSVSSGEFTVTGQPNLDFNITLPGTGTLTCTTGACAGSTIAIGSWASLPSGMGNTGSGSTLLNVGATITLTGNEPLGTYTGTFRVRVRSIGGPPPRRARADITVSVTIVPMVTITTLSNLQFGDVVAENTGGTVTVSPSGTVTASATAQSLGGASQAIFSLTGGANLSYLITLPASITIACVGGTGSCTPGSTLTVNAFTSTPGSPATLGPGGTGTLAVGATLQIGAGAGTGTYTGTFNVTVQYQ